MVLVSARKLVRGLVYSLVEFEWYSPKIPPQIETDDVQPKECGQKGNVNGVAHNGASEWILMAGAGQLNIGQNTVTDGKAEQVTHQTFSVYITKFRQTSIDEKCYQ